MKLPASFSAQMPALPTPSADALHHSRLLCQHIQQDIVAQQGWISFARYMELALYAPGLGYYSGGATKFGAAGDFVTAPDISPLFGKTLATSFADFFRAQAHLPKHILEFGAGTGQLAAQILNALGELDCVPARYDILELSGSLRARQQTTLAEHAPQWLDRVGWLDALPEHFSGVMVGNEVLDAMPVQLFTLHEQDVHERGVSLSAVDSAFCWSERPAGEALTALVRDIAAPLGDGYTSEICVAAQGFLRSLANCLQQGLLVLIDYGFPAREYYHPQRQQGTLMCHYRHHAHDDPFFYPGLQDITAHVDFSALANAAQQCGLTLLGYTSQARALINAGIVHQMAGLDRSDSVAYLTASRGLQTLLSESEMGELFKVIGFGKGRGVEMDCTLFSAGLRQL